MLAYGALDEPASGCWMRHNGVVTLYANRFATSMEDLGKFNRLDLTIASDGKPFAASTPSASARTPANESAGREPASHRASATIATGNARAWQAHTGP